MSEQAEHAKAMVRELRIREAGIKGDIRTLEDRLDRTRRELVRWLDELTDALIEAAPRPPS